MSIIRHRKIRNFLLRPKGQAKRKFTRNETRVFERDGWLCHYCSSGHQLTTDHKVPRSLGGSDELENLVTACKSCNSAKGTKSYEEFQEIIEAELAAFATWVEGYDYA